MSPARLGRLALLFILLALLALSAGMHMDVIGLLSQSLRLAIPIALGAFAGILCERSGVINIGLEGMMLSSACLGYVGALLTQSLAVGLICAVLASILLSILLAVLAIHLNMDQIIAGTVINIGAVGITGFIRRTFLLASDLPAPGTLPVIPIPVLHRIPVIGPILFQQQPIVYLGLCLLVILHIILFHTVWGLRTRACGEHPLAADTVGIHVRKLRFVNVTASGVITGLAGAWFTLETTGAFEDLMTGGKGFIALAALIFGGWKPIGAFQGAFLFGFADALQIKLQIYGIPIPHQFLGMLPYIITMVVLAGIIRRSTAPAADGQPYRRAS